MLDAPSPRVVGLAEAVEVPDLQQDWFDFKNGNIQTNSGVMTSVPSINVILRV